ncbi:MAG: hypothetical protein Q8R51_17870, partial [Azonexus sp.]|nr:hypothetical protein [Azonexus sp.]
MNALFALLNRLSVRNRIWGIVAILIGSTVLSSAIDMVMLRDALRQEGAEALAAHAFHLHEDGVVGQAFGSMADQLARQHRADGAVDVARLVHELDLLAALDCRT